MRPTPVALAAFFLAASAGFADAATTGLAPAASASPPPHFLSGFSHPDLTACQTMNTAQRVCIVPAGVGGSYVVEAAGWVTATGADSAMALRINVGQQICITQTLVKFTGLRYLHAVCEVTLATDAQLQITTNLEARNATLDPQGPRMIIHGMAWDGVVSLRGGDGGPLTPPASASAAPAPAAKAKTSH